MACNPFSYPLKSSRDASRITTGFRGGVPPNGYPQRHQREQEYAWVKAWRGRARVEFSSGTQMLENNETINTLTRKVTIRTKPAFTDKLSTIRIKIGADFYRILSRDIRDTDMATIMIVELINE